MSGLFAPTQLRSLTDRLHTLHVPTVGPCIYFLMLRGRVVYVGQSVGVYGRTEEHRRTKKFDTIHFVLVPREMLDAAEGAFIRSINPPLNRGAPREPRWGDVETFRRLGIRFRSSSVPMRLDLRTKPKRRGTLARMVRHVNRVKARLGLPPLVAEVTP